MSSTEPTPLGINPDDTQPFRAPAPPPEPRRSLERGAAWRVDRAAPELARLCAGWALRNQPVEELVGHVSDCRCWPKVFPRSALSSRFAPGETLDALRRIRSQRGRLAVVETDPDGSIDGRRPPREHHIVLPNVAVPDTAGLLEPLPAERRELLDRCIEQHLEWLRRILVKQLCDYETPDALYMNAFVLDRGGLFTIYPRGAAPPDDPPFIDAADYEAVPGKLLCIVRDWQTKAAAWIDLDQLDLGLMKDPCRERLYLMNELAASSGAPSD
jgi:hypothetical protein